MRSFYGEPCQVDLRGPGFQKPPLQTCFCSGPCKQNTGENGSFWNCFHRTAGFPESVALAKCNTGRG